ncbi:cation:proton antiporter [Nonomuraea soli]|uniref:Kef-type K+ transport system membrane component KefB n=1 Tax=Nonomuraea soli TaxID=1032476 RepID=A0A7W0HSQ7_9ACTN|nr:cation:proton antiporter [Nonomuraea soli]MBA2893921.1 Kef-type K+ transport system membrane component KefB [Nonomuraea soli]
MSSLDMTGVLVISLAAVLAPIAAASVARVIRVPNVVLEILLGVLVGPVVLGWVQVDELVNAVSEFGLAMLMFMAGFEINFQRVKGRPIRTAALGWFISFGVGMAIGLALFGFTTLAQVVGLCMTTTALGTILPMLRDSGALATPFGGRVLAIGALGEFGPIVAMAFIFSEDEKWHTIVVIALFTVIALTAAAMAARPRHPRLAQLVTATMTTSGQLGIRIVMFVLMLMLWLAASFRLDVLLGAFTAGIVIRLAVKSGPEEEQELVTSKLDAIGFGFLIPFFFVVSGVKLDLKAMFADPGSLLLIPLFLLLFLLVRGLPSLLLARRDPDVRPGEDRAVALFAAAALPLIVVITNTGVEAGVMSTATAAAIVTAGVFSVMIYPLVALRLYRAAERKCEDLPA